MARALDTTLRANLAGKRVLPAWFVDIEVARVWTGLGDLAVDAGAPYLGNGWLRPISVIPETPSLSPETMEIELSGPPDDLIAIVLRRLHRGLSCRVHLGMMHADAPNTLLGTTYEVWYGKFDTAEVRDGADSSSVILSYESPLARLGVARSVRYSDIQHQQEYPGDLGLQYLATAGTWDGSWITVERRS